MARTVLPVKRMRIHQLALLAVFVAVPSSGNVWSRAVTIEPRGLMTDIVQAPDGNALIVRQALGGPCVTRVLPTTAETNCYGPPNENNGGRMVLAADGYFVYGSNYAHEQRVESGFVFRVAANGDLKWARRYGLPTHVNFNGADVTNDGGLIIAGSIGRIETRTGPGYGQTSLALKIDGAGHIQWQRMFDASGGDIFSGVRTTSDGYVVVGSTEFGGWIYKLGATGDKQWKNVLPATSITSIARSQDGDFVVAGDTDEVSRRVDWFARFNARGEMKWQRAGDVRSNGLNEVFIDARGRLVAYKYLEQSGRNDAIAVLTFQGDGNAISQAAVSFPEPATATAIAPAKDGGLLVLVDAPVNHVEVHKFDAEAKVPECLATGRGPLREAFHALPATIAASTHPVTEARGTLAEFTQPAARLRSRASIGTACASGKAAPLGLLTPEASEDKAPGQSIEVKEFEDDLLRRIKARDFAGLDRMGSDLRQTRATFSDGSFKAFYFYETLAGARFGVHEVEPSEEERLAFVEEWLRRMPSSATAAIAAANTYEKMAWRARGAGFADTVTEAGGQKFDRDLDRANQILSTSAPFATGDPEYDVVRVAVNAASHCDEIHQLAHDRAIASRGYSRTFRTIAHFLLPMWCGTPTEYRQFAEFAAQSMPPGQSDELYGRLGLNALLFEEYSSMREKSHFFSEYAFDWPRMRRGLLDYAKRFPKATYVYQRLAWAAWRAGDRQLAHELFQRPELAWGEDAKTLWSGSAYYQTARDWALKEPAESFAAGSKWPPIILRNTIRLQDGTVVDGFNSFIVDAPAGPVAISALNRLDVQRKLFGHVVAAPIYVKELTAKLSLWTMSAPSDPGKVLTVDSIALRNYLEDPGSKVRGVVVTFKASSLPVHPLKQRVALMKLHSRAYVVGCQTGVTPCKQAVYTVEIHGRMPLTASGAGMFALEFDDNVDWHVFVGSPVIDEDGLVAGMVAEPYPGSDPSAEQPNRTTAEEIAFLLEKPGK